MKRLLVLAGAVALVAPGGAAARPSVYATVTGSSRAGVAQFNVLAGGLLAPKSPPKVGPANGLAGIALTPDGRTAYVAFNSTNPGTGPTRLGRVLLQYSINRTTGKLARKTPFRVRAGTAPTGIAVAPNGAHAYAGNSFSSTISQYRIDRRTGRLAPLSPPTVRTGIGPLDVAVSPNGRSLYAANTNEGEHGVSQYTIRANGTLVPKAPAAVDANQPSNVVLTPDGRSAYAPVLEGIEQYSVDASGRLTPKDPPILPAGFAVDGTAVTPNGRSLYVGSEKGISQFSIDPGTGKLTPKTPATVLVPGQSDPSVNDLQVTPDGRTLYAAGACCTSLFQFNISPVSGNLAAKTPPSVGSVDIPQVVAVAPDAPVAAFSARRSGLVVRFDGSGSYDPGARIARFTWSFGDGSGLASGPPRPRHRFRRPGRYRVTLTLVSANGCSRGELIFTGHVAICAGARARVSHVVPVRPR